MADLTELETVDESPTPSESSPREDAARPYFFWDRRITAAELRDAIASADHPEHLDLLAHVMREARPDEVWRFVTPAQVASEWSSLAPRLGRRREFWAWTIEHAGLNYPDNFLAGTQSVSIHLTRRSLCKVFGGCNPTFVEWECAFNDTGQTSLGPRQFNIRVYLNAATRQNLPRALAIESTEHGLRTQSVEPPFHDAHMLAESYSVSINDFDDLNCPNYGAGGGSMCNDNGPLGWNISPLMITQFGEKENPPPSSMPAPTRAVGMAPIDVYRTSLNLQPARWDVCLGSISQTPCDLHIDEGCCPAPSRETLFDQVQNVSLTDRPITWHVGSGSWPRSRPVWISDMREAAQSWNNKFRPTLGYDLLQESTSPNADVIVRPVTTLSRWLILDPDNPFARALTQTEYRGSLASTENDFNLLPCITITNLKYDGARIFVNTSIPTTWNSTDEVDFVINSTTSSTKPTINKYPAITTLAHELTHFLGMHHPYFGAGDPGNCALAPSIDQRISCPISVESDNPTFIGQPVVGTKGWTPDAASESAAICWLRRLPSPLPERRR